MTKEQPSNPFLLAVARLKEDDKHRPINYVERNASKLRKEYGSQVIVVTGTGVLGHGSNLDKVLEQVDLSSPRLKKAVAGTVDSILKERYVWVKNDYAGIPGDMLTRHPYIRAQSIELRARLNAGYLPLRLRDTRVSQARVHAAREAMQEDRRARTDIYVMGKGYTASDFSRLRKVE